LTDEFEEDMKIRIIRDWHTVARDRQEWRRAVREAKVHNVLESWRTRTRRSRRRRRRVRRRKKRRRRQRRRRGRRVNKHKLSYFSTTE
jgi:hypothetical protein